LSPRIVHSLRLFKVQIDHGGTCGHPPLKRQKLGPISAMPSTIDGPGLVNGLVHELLRDPLAARLGLRL
jgi:hypothetical protein